MPSAPGCQAPNDVAGQEVLKSVRVCASKQSAVNNIFVYTAKCHIAKKLRSVQESEATEKNGQSDVWRVCVCVCARQRYNNNNNDDNGEAENKNGFVSWLGCVLMAYLSFESFRMFHPQRVDSGRSERRARADASRVAENE